MENEKLTVEKILNITTDFFKKKNLFSPRLDAEILLAFALGIERINLFTEFTKPLTDAEVSKYRNFVLNRSKGMPVAYITGEKEFYGIPIKVNQNVLIPRPETELLVEIAIKYFKDKNYDKIRAVDIGCGSGCISIALAKYLPSIEIYAVDIDENSISIAYDNVLQYGLLKNIKFVKSDLFDFISDINLNFDLIISNPPYISEKEINSLPNDVIKYEPYKALISGKTGTEIIEKILYKGYDYLNQNGLLLLEISPLISDRIRNLISLNFTCYNNYEILKDFSQFDRVLKYIKY